MNDIINKFKVKGQMLSAEPYGSGHINDTYLVVNEYNKKPIRYILQRINNKIFKDIPKLMENIELVTEHVRAKVIAENGDINRECLTLIKTIDNKAFYFDEANKSYYRLYIYVENNVTYQKVENKKQFYDCGKAFGKYMNLLADFDSTKLFESIKDFHDTTVRYENFLESLHADIKGRAELVKNEIDFVLAHLKDCSIIVDAIKNKEIPLRVTHNDTKLNNILFDDKTDEPICVIDLDTIMPGSALYDFGDSIRFGCNTASEDEIDLSKVNFDLDLFYEFSNGYLKQTKDVLNEIEIKMLPLGAKIMTLECGIRFLTDFLNGDTYFKIHREYHNLDRARTQFKLVSEMEKNMNDLNSIISLIIKGGKEI